MPVTTEMENLVIHQIIVIPPTRDDVVLCAESCDDGKLTACDQGHAVSPEGRIKLLTFDGGGCMIHDKGRKEDCALSC